MAETLELAIDVLGDEVDQERCRPALVEVVAQAEQEPAIAQGVLRYEPKLGQRVEYNTLWFQLVEAAQQRAIGLA